MKTIIQTTILGILLTLLSSITFIGNYFFKSEPLDNIVAEYHRYPEAVNEAKKIIPRMLIDIKTAKNLNKKTIPYRPYFQDLDGVFRSAVMDLVDAELLRLGYKPPTCGCGGDGDPLTILIFPKFYDFISFWISLVVFILFVGIPGVAFFDDIVRDIKRDFEFTSQTRYKRKENFITKFLIKLGSK